MTSKGMISNRDVGL